MKFIAHFRSVRVRACMTSTVIPPPICPWKFLSTATTLLTKLSEGPSCSFAQALFNSNDLAFTQLSKPCIKGDSICIKLIQEVYDRGVEGCKNNLHGRLVMSKGDRPLTSCYLSS
ncbi:hypothetical protein MTR_7g053210 [Medicago truncatula]|uniref:Uncharacterized protein n=1 Tax=Medicago truncatula TaxID=3880 RepID=A0A072TYF4_MEDTR|nr:hypothetical protein MTR_7g053210 [Medicago truncatula]